MTAASRVVTRFLSAREPSTFKGEARTLTLMNRLGPKVEVQSHRVEKLAAQIEKLLSRYKGYDYSKAMVAVEKLMDNLAAFIETGEKVFDLLQGLGDRHVDRKDMAPLERVKFQDLMKDLGPQLYEQLKDLKQQGKDFDRKMPLSFDLMQLTKAVDKAYGTIFNIHATLLSLLPD